MTPLRRFWGFLETSQTPNNACLYNINSYLLATVTVIAWQCLHGLGNVWIHCLCQLSNGAMHYLALKIKYTLSLNDIIAMNIIEHAQTLLQ